LFGAFGAAVKTSTPSTDRGYGLDKTLWDLVPELAYPTFVQLPHRLDLNPLSPAPMVTIAAVLSFASVSLSSPVNPLSRAHERLALPLLL
jgi:hypothetical protein